jgi:hypothetical protein
MSSAEIYRAKADVLMKQATETENMAERSRLISEAVRWRMMGQALEDVQEATDRLRWLDPDLGPWEAEEP